MVEVPQSSAMKWGIEHEADAKIAIERQLGGSILNCGLFVSKSHSFIGASPDGIYDDCLVEIKCPFILRESEPTDFSNLSKQQKWNFCSKITPDGLRLKKNHNYYCQVQVQMFVTGYSKTLFAI